MRSQPRRRRCVVPNRRNGCLNAKPAPSKTVRRTQPPKRLFECEASPVEDGASYPTAETVVFQFPLNSKKTVLWGKHPDLAKSLLFFIPSGRPFIFFPLLLFHSIKGKLMGVQGFFFSRCSLQNPGDCAGPCKGLLCKVSFGRAQKKRLFHNRGQVLWILGLRGF